MNIDKKIRSLPDEIINEILQYIPREKMMFVNSKYYNLYHYSLKCRICLYESYVRDMIMKDCFFVFERLIRENIEEWIRNRQYRYKDMVFNNYIYFILHYCFETNSERCRNILIEELSKRNLCRNLHKKNVIKYIKWKI